ncbi:YidC/Oxa1 family membrane protein insertase [Candidatus Uhrbacteria bacterium]|nr:YidC/Oxa1 family membrane protein insertase [Candidatus Uhrbacteria bacterium]
MIAEIWHDYLFAPLLNFLFWLYNGPAYENLGLAVVYMTVGLRVALIPFSIISERNNYKFERVQKEITEISRSFKDDSVARKEQIRKIFKLYRIRPWASTVLLGIQLLALVLLYQVFVGGTSGKLTALYPSVTHPDIINTKFIIFDIAERNLYLAGLVAVLIFWQVNRQQIKRRDTLQKGDIIFRYVFPVGTFVILALLPAVKAVFILTAMVFSFIIHLLQPLLIRSKTIVKQTKVPWYDKLLSGG